MKKLDWNFEAMMKHSADQILKSVTKPLRLNIQFFAEEEIPPYTFGLADISIEDDEGTLIELNGAKYLQADAGEISLVPTFRDIVFKDFGETVVERRLSGWTGTVTFVVGQEDLALLKLALSSTDDIMSADATPVRTGITDARMGTKLKGYKVTIHPRIFPPSDKRFDYVIYQMASTGGITKPYDDAQTNFTITLNMMPRKGMNASQGSNFFYTGNVDPNAVVTTP